MQNDNELSLNSWFKACSHISISWRVGVRSTNFAINNCSFQRAMCAFTFCISTLKVMASFLTKNPLKFLSRFVGETSPTSPLYKLSCPSKIWLLASANPCRLAFVISTSRFGFSLAIHPHFSSSIWLNLSPPPNRTFSAKVSNWQPSLSPLVISVDPSPTLYFGSSRSNWSSANSPRSLSFPVSASCLCCYLSYDTLI